MKERKSEREGGKKSIAIPGVTAAVIAFKSVGSHWSFKKKKFSQFCFD